MELIIKPTEACNGNCVYCAARGMPAAQTRMHASRLTTLFNNIANWLVENPDASVRFVWHGGEPLLMGRDFYAAVIDAQREAFGSNLRRVRNTMQSNLVLIGEEWIPTLRELLRGECIGTSFDLVDGVRGLANGRSLPRAWVRAVCILQDHAIRVGVVYVVHVRSLPMARDLFYFFRNLGVSGIRFNPIYREGRGSNPQNEDLLITPEQYARFLLDLLELWLEEGRRFPVAPLNEWYAAWHGKKRLCCDSRGDCHRTHLGISPDGSVYGCGRFADHRQRQLGNLFTDGFTELLERRASMETTVRAQHLRRQPCGECRFWELCHGGCPVMAEIYHGSGLREDYFCSARLQVYEALERRLGPPRLREREREASCHGQPA